MLTKKLDLLEGGKEVAQVGDDSTWSYHSFHSTGTFFAGGQGFVGESGRLKERIIDRTNLSVLLY